MTQKSMTLMAAARDFFGYREGQPTTALAFASEWRALSDDDKSDIKKGLAQNGYLITGSLADKK